MDPNNQTNPIPPSANTFNAPPVEPIPDTSNPSGSPASPQPIPIQPMPQAPMPQSTFNLITTPAPKSKKKLALLVIIAGVLFIALGGGIVYFIQKQPSSQTADNQIQTTSPVSLSPNTSEPPPNSQKIQKRTAINPETLTVFTAEELQAVGIVPLPKGFSIQEEYKGVRFVRSPQKEFSQSDLTFLKRFLDRTPNKLLDNSSAVIVTYDKSEVNLGLGNIDVSRIAFASGNYVYFNDQSFNGGTFSSLDGTDNLDTTFESFEHELVHVYQYNQIIDQLASTDIANSQDRYLLTNLMIDSSFMREFATIADWQKGESQIPGEVVYKLTNEDTKTTKYAKTNMLEDMAETIRVVVALHDFEVSPARQKWAYQFLQTTRDNLSKLGLFPYFEDSPPVAGVISYNAEVYDAYKLKYPKYDKRNFLNQTAMPLDQVAQRYIDELQARGWTWSGNLDKKNDYDKVAISSTLFTSPERDIYIELRNYDNAEGYSQKPTGTVVTVISGYY